MVIFQGLQIADGSLMAIVFRRWIKPDEERAAADKGLEQGQEKQQGGNG